MTMSGKRDLWVGVAIFVLGISIFWCFRALGWFAQDEGVLYYHYLRTYRGQLPYRDFFTGYGPVSLYLHSLVFAVLGVSMDTTRVFMGVINAAAGVLTFFVMRRVASWPFAAIPALLFFTLQPGDIADMAFHNTPYPLWYMVILFSAATWGMLRATEASSARAALSWWFFVGLVGGVTLFTKQNGGIFLLWGASGFLASFPQVQDDGARESLLGRYLRIAYLALIPTAMLFLIWTFVSAQSFAAFIVPLSLLVWVGTLRGFSAAAIRRAVGSMFCVGAGVIVALAPWFLPFVNTIGFTGFIRALFFWGKYIDRQLFLAFPMPGQLAAFVLAVVLATWFSVTVFGRYRDRKKPKWFWPSVIVANASVWGAVVAFLLYYRADVRRIFLLHYNPWRIYQEASLALDSALSYLVFPVMLGGLVMALRHARGERRSYEPDAGSYLCILWMAICSLLLYYPRMDAAHYVSSAVLLYGVAAVLVEVGAARIADIAPEGTGLRWRRAFLVPTGIAVLFAANLKLAPKVYSLVMLRKEGSGLPLVATPHEEYRYDRLNVYFPIYEKAHRLSHRAFRDTIAYIREQTRADEPIFAFPAYPMLYFASERDNPTRHDYFLSNNVPFDEQVRLIDTLERSKVRLLVAPSDKNDYFVKIGRPFHNLIWAYVREEYYLERRFGAYDVWRRYDAPVAVTDERSDSVESVDVVL